MAACRVACETEKGASPTAREAKSVGCKEVGISVRRRSNVWQGSATYESCREACRGQEGDAGESEHVGR